MRFRNNNNNKRDAHGVDRSLSDSACSKNECESQVFYARGPLEPRACDVGEFVVLENSFFFYP